VLLLRWRSSQLGQVEQDAAQSLAQARDEIQQIAGANVSRMSLGDVVAQRQLSRDTIEQLTGMVLQQSDSPALRAQALLARGDLHWTLANAKWPAPTVEPAATQPSTEAAATQPATAPSGEMILSTNGRNQTPSMSPEEHLAAAQSAYEQILTEHGQQAHAVAAARLGLAAIAETRSDWDQAQQHYNALADGEQFPEVYRTQARARLAELASLRNPPILAQPTTAPFDQNMLGQLLAPPQSADALTLDLPGITPAAAATQPVEQPAPAATQPVTP
jgi:hypothetical protein